jgi:hypothetical protein
MTAALLRERGFALCKPDPVEKKPTYKGWPTASLEPWDFRPGDQLGIIGGPLSDGSRPGHALVEIDLDAADAVARADDVLPPTGMEDGRPGKPRSHRYFLVPFDSIPTWAVSQAEQAAPAARKQRGHAGPFTKSFRHAETGSEVLKFVGTGGQVVCPPSLHDSGERRQWTGGEPGESAAVPFLDLWHAACDLGEVCGAKVPLVAVAAAPPSPKTRRSAVPDDAFVRRAVAYLAKYPPAVSGQGGHSRLMYAARVVVYEFGLGRQLGFELLRDHYNPRCEPPWTEAELWHKVHEVDAVPFGKPREWRRERDARPRRLLASTLGRLAAFADRKEAARRGH